MQNSESDVCYFLRNYNLKQSFNELITVFVIFPPRCVQLHREMFSRK